MISLLVPTRQRPEGLKRLYQSAKDMADRPKQIEVVCYIDDDDNSYGKLDWPELKVIGGPRLHDGKVNLSIKWNECWKIATGPYYGHMGDDIVFRTRGWDKKVIEAIDARPKKIAFVWGNDTSPESDRHIFGTHGFVHKNWTDVIGRFVPPYFVSDYNDTWFNDVAEALHVRTYLPDVQTEHMHFSLGKAEKDQNTLDRLARHDADNPEKIYNSAECVAEREEERRKLQEFINA